MLLVVVGGVVVGVVGVVTLDWSVLVCGRSGELGTTDY